MNARYVVTTVVSYIKLGADIRAHLRYQLFIGEMHFV